MLRRDLQKKLPLGVLAALILAAPVGAQVAARDLFKRPVHFPYANKSGISATDSIEDILAAIDALREDQKPTIMIPSILNTDPADYMGFIQQLWDRGIETCFAAGKKIDDSNELQSKIDDIRQFARLYRNVGARCMRIDHFNDIVNVWNNDTAVQDFLTSIKNMGFDHLMINPWEGRDDGTAWDDVSATYNGIRPEHGFDVKHNRIATIKDSDPNLIVVCHYENAKIHELLDSFDNLPDNTASKLAMTVAIDGQVTHRDGYQWAPPWSHNYSMYAHDTLNWAAGKWARAQSFAQMTMIVGTSDNDELYATDTDRVVWGKSGGDTIHGSALDDLLDGDNGPDVIIGHEGNDILLGRDAKDDLFGRKGNDTLEGGEGNDTLDGGGGDDILIGGNGHDKYIYEFGEGNDLISAYETGGGVRNERLTIKVATPDLIEFGLDGYHLRIMHPNFQGSVTIVNHYFPGGDFLLTTLFADKMDGSDPQEVAIPSQEEL